MKMTCCSLKRLTGFSSMSVNIRWWPLLAVFLLASPSQTLAAAKTPAYAVMGERLQTLNNRILADRVRLSGIAEQYLTSDDISEDDFNWLKITAEEYGLQPRQRGDQNFFNALLSRLDVVPPSLALGQGWLEYAWRSPNPVRIQRPRSVQKTLPLLPPEDMHAWVHKVNTDPRYIPFRTLRSELRRQHKPLSAKALAATLEPITSEGSRYTLRLTAVIRQLHLDRWDPKN